jgi:hypothetical protein
LDLTIGLKRKGDDCGLDDYFLIIDAGCGHGILSIFSGVGVMVRTIGVPTVSLRLYPGLSIWEI